MDTKKLMMMFSKLWPAALCAENNKSDWREGLAYPFALANGYQEEFLAAYCP
jgi:hypothetical protein